MLDLSNMKSCKALFYIAYRINFKAILLLLMFVGPCIIVVTDELKPSRCHLLFYCTSYRLNMFRTLLCPSSGARDYNVDYHIGRFVPGLLYVAG